MLQPLAGGGGALLGATYGDAILAGTLFGGEATAEFGPGALGRALVGGALGAGAFYASGVCGG